MRVLFKAADKPAYAHPSGSSVFLNIHLRIVVVIKKLHGESHLLVQIVIFFGMLSGKLPVNQNKKLLKEQGQELRVVGLAPLQLIDHLLKNPGTVALHDLVGNFPSSVEGGWMHENGVLFQPGQLVLVHAVEAACPVFNGKPQEIAENPVITIANAIQPILFNIVLFFI